MYSGAREDLKCRRESIADAGEDLKCERESIAGNVRILSLNVRVLRVQVKI
ncbi:hypothetical protein DPMN_032483 [Dreissena polymorpha]|uniref:Uncharacterized protein n=1 Tax=Dreissena polymorpha TaxID=45954 RepID=A0A9D4M3U5_DREPO|nr:hypothetical protein DPMN_032483 [Dreissena polymorpha]